MELFTEVLESLIGKGVIIFTLGPVPLSGKLIKVTASFIELQLERGSMDPLRSEYIPRDKIVAIVENNVNYY